jgi:hypothetical protein
MEDAFTFLPTLYMQLATYSYERKMLRIKHVEENETRFISCIFPL